MLPPLKHEERKAVITEVMSCFWMRFEDLHRQYLPSFG